MEPLIPVDSLKQALGQMAPSGSGTDQAFVRVVRMSFRMDCTDRFVLLFEENKGRIAGHKGCRFVYLLRCGDTFFTISGWDRPEDLETYRTSALFRDVWKQTKSWLSEPAQAWSCPITAWALHGAQQAVKTRD